MRSRPTFDHYRLAGWGMIIMDAKQNFLDFKFKLAPTILEVSVFHAPRELLRRVAGKPPDYLNILQTFGKLTDNLDCFLTSPKASRIF